MLSSHNAHVKMFKLISRILVLFFGIYVTSMADPVIVVQSTTSTANSGLYGSILPQFEKQTGIRVNVVAGGTGQAIKNATRGDGDVLLVHATAAEEKFVADGWGVDRFDLMYNDFIFVGPDNDPAGLSDATSAVDALIRISSGRALFASRGDDSGTHQKERLLWTSAGIDPTTSSGDWYRETGSGMGATLNVAVGMNAYAMTDRATWMRFGNKLGFKIVFDNDQQLFNQYGIILVNPSRHPHVNAKDGQIFINWMLGEKGQMAIANFTLDGQQLFFPNAD